MSLAMHPFKDNEASGISLLAALIKGRGLVAKDEDGETRRQVSFRMDNDLHDKINELARSSYLTKTEVFELLLWDSLRRLEEYMAINDEVEK